MNNSNQVKAQYTSLPWFIRKEIIHYAVNEDFDYLCLVNKEWFEASAGQFIIIHCCHLKKYLQPPDWLKVAERMEIYEPEDFNYVFLNKCTQLRTAEISLNEKFTSVFERFTEWVWKSKLNSFFLFLDEDGNHTKYIQLLKGINKQVISLNLFTEDDSYSELLTLGYPNLKKLVIFKSDGYIFLEAIHKFMPNIEELEFRTQYVDYLPPALEPYTFSSLKSLKIECRGGVESVMFENILDLFNCYFPNLVTFSVDGIYCEDTIELIPLNMPKIKYLDLSILFEYSTTVLFPSQPLLYLEEFIFDACSDINAIFFELDLSKTPKLRRLVITPQLAFKISNENHCPVIEYVCFRRNFNSSFELIYSNLNFLNEIEISFKVPDSEYAKLFRFCKGIKKLAIQCIERPIPVSILPSGPFKITFLILTGNDFLSNEVLNWLANELQLSSLVVELYSETNFNLNPIVFPHLQQLRTSSTDYETNNYLKTIFLLPTDNK